MKGWKWDRHGNFVLQFEDRSRAREQLMKHFGLCQADRRNDQDDGAMLLATALWQFVISLHASKGLPIAAALRTAEAIRIWWRSGDGRMGRPATLNKTRRLQGERLYRLVSLGPT